MVFDGKTRLRERIKNGVVVSRRDGSIDELFFQKYVWAGDRVQKKPPAKAVIVPETWFNAQDTAASLGLRVQAHIAVVRRYGEFWPMVLSGL